MEDNYIVATKFYFISPVDLLNPVIDALIRLEFETYTLQREDRSRLFKLLDIRSQHVIFISLRNRKEAQEWLETSSEIMQKNHIKIILGAFVYSNINEDLLDEFHKNGIEVIPFTRVKENAFEVIRKIITLFNANNRRKYIRAKAGGQCLALLQKRDQDLTIRAEIIDISTHAFSCKIDPKDEDLIQKSLYRDVFLTLKGMQIQVSARLIGHRDEGTERSYLFTICGDGRETESSPISQKIPSFIRKRLHSFIKNFLSNNIRQRLTLFNEGY